MKDKNCFLLGFDLKSLGWEPTVITCRLHSDITVLLKFYISMHKVLEQSGRYFTPMKLWKCSQSLHPLPKVASTPGIEQIPTHP